MLNTYLAEHLRIAIQCSQAAQRQCQMFLMMPWLLWLPRPQANEPKEDP